MAVDLLNSFQMAAKSCCREKQQPTYGLDPVSGMNVGQDDGPLHYEYKGFEIAFHTHSVDLSLVPVAISTLELDNNLTLKPEKWDGAPPGGHHHSGTLIFKSIPEETKSLKLTLRNVAGVPERTFAWDLARK